MKAFRITWPTELQTLQPDRIFVYLHGMKVTFRDDQTQVEVEDKKALVDWMRENSRTLYANNYDFMLAYARRAVMLNDEDIRATSEEEFVDDLMELGQIHISQIS